MRVKFQNDARYRPAQSRSTAASLGIVAHKLLEEATTGKLDGIGDTLTSGLKDRWDVLIRQEYQRLSELSELPVPDWKTWRRHAVRAATTIAACKRILSQRQGQVIAEPVGTAKPKYGSEVWYEGFGGKMVGVIDLVRSVNGKVEILDYKSGGITNVEESSGPNESPLKESYRRQVLLYASLYHDYWSEWPDVATVESLEDGAISMAIEPAECLELTQTTLKLLDNYNESVKNQDVRATPDSDTCRFCSFKAVCKDYLTVANEEWATFLNTILGRPEEGPIGDSGQLAIDVIGGNTPLGASKLRGLPEGYSSELKSLISPKVSFSELVRYPGTQDYRYQWNSQMWIWPK